jgi:hypothetical protein
VKFMIKCFEANYPESLGAVLIHKAPWIFQGIWKMIKGWLDPVVASKVHFTNNVEDITEFIEPSNIIKEVDGPDEWSYKYMEPVPGENDSMKEEDRRDELRQQRKQHAKDYEQVIKEWLKTKNEGDSWAGLRERRDDVAGRLRRNYWEIDPHIRARSYYDRIGYIKGDVS